MTKERIREIVRGRSVTVCSNWAQDGQRIDRLQEYVEAAIMLAVDEALEAAAKVCVQVAYDVNESDSKHPGHEMAGAAQCLERIRALKVGEP